MKPYPKTQLSGKYFNNRKEWSEREKKYAYEWCETDGRWFRKGSAGLKRFEELDAELCARMLCGCMYMDLGRDIVAVVAACRHHHHHQCVSLSQSQQKVAEQAGAAYLVHTAVAQSGIFYIGTSTWRARNGNCFPSSNTHTPHTNSRTLILTLKCVCVWLIHNAKWMNDKIIIGDGCACDEWDGRFNGQIICLASWPPENGSVLTFRAPLYYIYLWYDGMCILCY